jgi:glycosyltransferase involved in cell wall biosynthesis
MTKASRPPLVTFAIPLRRPISVVDRARLDEILALTLRSIFQQTDPDFRVLLGGAHEPALPSFVDGRLESVAVAGWCTDSWDDGNREGGARRYALARRFAEFGGGYLMFCDHDDFVSRHLVEHVRKTADPNGYAASEGYLYDATKNVLARYPIAGFSSGELHRFCGSSLIMRLTQVDILDELANGKTFFEQAYGSGHHLAADRFAACGRPLADIPFPSVVYARNTGANMSRHVANLGDEGRRQWLEDLDEAAIANHIDNDEQLRREFGLPARYPLTEIDPPISITTASQSPSLSILVCTHRRPKGLEALLEALVPQVDEHARCEIVVVNDGTHDETYAAIAARFAGNILYCVLEQNVGIAEARNAAAKMAAGDYLVFTDDDCVPPPFWVDWLAARLAQHPELDVVAGTTKPLWPKKPGFVARMRAVHELIPMTAVTRETIIFPTAIVAVRRKLFDRLGGFGFPDFDGAGEDTEFATRLSLAGAAGAYDPSWFTCHEVNEGFLALCDRYRRYGLANGRLIGLTTSPVAHDYMRTHWRAGWRTIWRWEYTGRRAAAHAAYRNRFAAIASATLATLVRLSYWRGVKEAFRPAA